MWSKFTRRVTEETLAAGGVEISRRSLRMHDNLTATPAEQKAAQTPIRGGTVVAFFDDNTETLQAVRDAYPEILPVRVVPTGFASEAPPEQRAFEFYRVGTFQRP